MEMFPKCFLWKMQQAFSFEQTGFFRLFTPKKVFAERI